MFDGCCFSCLFLARPGPPCPENKRRSGVACRRPCDVLEKERANGRRPSEEHRASGLVEADEETGDWFCEPLDNPLLFSTEQRYEPVPKGEEASTDVWRLAVFMSPLDVHVNRAPAAGVIERIEHRTGKEGAEDRFGPPTPKKVNSTNGFVQFIALKMGTESK